MSLNYPIAIIPVRDEYNNYFTKLILPNGKAHLEYQSLSQFMERLHTDPRVSYASNQNFARTYLLIKNNPPIILDPHHVYFTCKLREGADKKHGCYGYISLACVKAIQDSSIHLINDEIIPTYASPRQLIKSMVNAYFLYLKFTQDYRTDLTLPQYTQDLLRELIAKLNSGHFLFK